VDRPSTQDITTGLDLAGLLAVAGGIGAWSASRIGWAGLAVAGAILLAGSAYISTVSRPGYVPVRRRLAATVGGLVLRYRTWRIVRKDRRRQVGARAVGLGA
jgi:hypothetical protein